MDLPPRDQIARHMQVGAYAEARTLLQAELAKTPEDWRLHQDLGMVARATGDHAQALSCLARAGRLLVEESLRSDGISDPAGLFEELKTPAESLWILKPSSFSVGRAPLSRTLDYATLCNAMGMSLLELGHIPDARRMFCEAVEFITDGQTYDEPWVWLSRIEDM
jgi:tetratricopeptide (TPR) repeat protein